MSMRSGSKWCFVLLGLVLACTAPEPAATRVVLTVGYEESWGMSALEVHALGQTDRTAVLPELLLLLPERVAGEPLDVEIWGLRGETRIAHGRTTVVPVRRGKATERVDMSRVPCGAWCTEGTTRCSGDAVVLCEQRDEDVCFEWSDALPCPPSSPYCSLGVCDIDCVSECAAGERACDGPSAMRLCGQGDMDPCLEWLDSQACAAGEVCSAGVCGTCASECTAGEARCSGSGWQVCGDLNLDGCAEWGPVEACGEGTSCTDGACGAVCRDECTVAVCDGGTYRECGNYDWDTCKDLASGITCAASSGCFEGTCSATGCEESPLMCSSPPESMCLTDHTLRVYDTAGTCEAGSCGYASRDVECPRCPACSDPCAGVTCNTPPSVCFARTGTCSGGSCGYAYADGASCDDGNACTTGDTCSSGVCAGTGSGALATYYRDADGDGYGVGSVSTTACSVPLGYSAMSGDCDDTCASCHPAGSETCDGRDNDCDGSVDESLGRACGMGTGGYLADCVADTDCASGKCIAERAGSPRVCTTSCTRDRDCADWHFCANSVAGGPGFCAWDDIGHPCSGEMSGGECVLACIHAGPGSGHCTHRCSTAADCAGGYACALSDPRDARSEKMCAWVHKACPSGAAECPTGLGGCGSSPDGTQCSGACTSASDCPPIFGGIYTCATFEGIPLCSPPTAAVGASGEPCIANSECRSGACALVESGAPTGICMERCNPTSGCAEGFGCNAVRIADMGINANVCVPAGLGRSGAPCTLNRNCRSGICGTASGLCIDSCQNGFCPPGFTCTPEGLTVDGIMLRSCRR